MQSISMLDNPPDFTIFKHSILSSFYFGLRSPSVKKNYIKKQTKKKAKFFLDNISTYVYFFLKSFNNYTYKLHVSFPRTTIIYDQRRRVQRLIWVYHSSPYRKIKRNLTVVQSTNPEFWFSMINQCFLVSNFLNDQSDFLQFFWSHGFIYRVN